MIDGVLLEELKGLDWVNITRVLTAYSIVKTKNKNFSRDKEPKDFVQDAILRVFEGRRKWDKQHYPDIIDFLKGVVDSLISNEINSSKNKNEENSVAAIVENSEKSFNSEIVSSPEEVLVEEEEQEEYLEAQSQQYEEVMDAIKDDDDLLIYVEYLKKGYKPAEVSKKMGVEISEVYNLTKKLKRRIMT